jgi:hypothetical protein
MARGTAERFQRYAPLVAVERLSASLNVANVRGYELTAKALGALLIRAMARAGL